MKDTDGIKIVRVYLWRTKCIIILLVIISENQAFYLSTEYKCENMFCVGSFHRS